MQQHKNQSNMYSPNGKRSTTRYEILSPFCLPADVFLTELWNMHDPAVYTVNILRMGVPQIVPD